MFSASIPSTARAGRGTGPGQSRRELDDACHRPLGVVGVDQQRRPIRPRARERPEGIGLRIQTLRSLEEESLQEQKALRAK